VMRWGCARTRVPLWREAIDPVICTHIVAISSLVTTLSGVDLRGNPERDAREHVSGCQQWWNTCEHVSLHPHPHGSAQRRVSDSLSSLQWPVEKHHSEGGTCPYGPCAVRTLSPPPLVSCLSVPLPVRSLNAHRVTCHTRMQALSEGQLARPTLAHKRYANCRISHLANNTRYGGEGNALALASCKPRVCVRQEKSCGEQTQQPHKEGVSLTT
jgi:hypothetical protein